MFCPASKFCRINCKIETINNVMVTVMILEGKNCFLKNFCNCFGEAPNVINKIISSLAEAIVSCMNKVNISKANKSIKPPITHDVMTTIFMIPLNFSNLVFSEFVERWCCDKYSINCGLEASLVCMITLEGC